MMYPVETPEAWAKKYGLNLNEPHFCKSCGEQIQFVTPFAHREWRGLMSDHKKCGAEFIQSIFITTDSMFIGKWHGDLREDKPNEQN